MLALLLLAVIPLQEPAVTVDLAELNHFYDDNGRLVFDQIIFYSWSEVESRMQVREWSLMSTPATATAPSRCSIPEFRHDLKVYVSYFNHPWFFKIYSRDYAETWTQYDPELAEREILPKEKRQPLFRSRQVWR